MQQQLVEALLIRKQFQFYLKVILVKQVLQVKKQYQELFIIQAVMHVI
jgi:hypothetical protein